MSHRSPAFGGKCAFAVSMGSAPKAPQGRQDCYLDKDGVTYLFTSPVAKFLFKAIPGSASRAQKHWDKW